MLFSFLLCFRLIRELITSFIIRYIVFDCCFYLLGLSLLSFWAAIYLQKREREKRKEKRNMCRDATTGGSKKRTGTTMHRIPSHIPKDQIGSDKKNNEVRIYIEGRCRMVSYHPRTETRAKNIDAIIYALEFLLHRCRVITQLKKGVLNRGVR